MAGVDFVAIDPAFHRIVGEQPEAAVLAETETTSKLPLYHEACVYHAASRSVFVTSNQYPSDKPSPKTGEKQVKLLRIFDDESPQVTPGRMRVEDVTTAEVGAAMLNGGVNYGDGSLLFCAQGSLDTEGPSGIVIFQIPMSAHPASGRLENLVADFHSIPFNSVNDVIVHPEDGSVWFTDPCYGHHQGIRPPPQLPNQVYRFDPKTRSIRAVADGFTRPNGLCFSPDLKTLYVTDTGAIHGSSTVPIDLAGPSHIYAFDIVDPVPSAPFLQNRRLFAFAPGRFPDGIKCDLQGNVYSGCGDGIDIWNPHGVLLGFIKIPGGVANFCFGEHGTIYACNETKFWRVILKGDNVRGALLGI